MHEGGVNNGRERVDNARAEGLGLIPMILSYAILKTPSCLPKSRPFCFNA